METENIVKKVISLAGGQTRFAVAMGVSTQLVQHWEGRGYIPLKHIPTAVKNFPEFTYKDFVLAARRDN